MRRVADLRLGFVGHGVHACANLYPSITLAGGSVCCVTTRSTNSATLAADAIGAERAYDDLGRMLKHETLDGVFISVAPEDQADLTKQCIQAGVPVFVEKPLGMNAGDARDVADLADSHGVQVMVGFMKRFAPAYQTLANLITDQKQFGRIIMVDASFCFAPWDAGLRDDTYLKFGAIHIVDLLRTLFGEVSDVCGNRSSQGADIGMAFSLRFANKTVATLSLCGVPSWAREQERLTVTGTQGWAEANNLSEVRYHLRDKSQSDMDRWQTLDEKTIQLTAINSPMSGGARDLYQRGFAGEIAHFLDCIVKGIEPKTNARDNVATMTLCDRLINAVT